MADAAGPHTLVVPGGEAPAAPARVCSAMAATTGFPAFRQGRVPSRLAEVPGPCLVTGIRRKGEEFVFRAIADVLRQIGGAIATVVTLPFRAVARLFGGASSSARGSRA
jgi:hypothetical protein